MQNLKHFARVALGAAAFAVAIWMLASFDPVRFENDANYMAAYAASWWAGPIPGVFLVLIGLRPAVFVRAATRRHDVLPAEGGKGAPVGSAVFQIPAAVFPLALVFLSGLVSAVGSIGLPWHLAHGADPTWIAALALYGVSGAVAARDSAAFIRNAFALSAAKRVPDA